MEIIGETARFVCVRKNKFCIQQDIRHTTEQGEERLRGE